MVFGLDSDASIVLGLSVLVTLLNVSFISVTFIYFCCCIEVVNTSSLSEHVALPGEQMHAQQRRRNSSSSTSLDFDFDKRSEFKDLMSTHV
jgi:hypothetical protein